MKVEIQVKKEFEIKVLAVAAEPIGWEDAVINGEDDTENGDNIPCKNGNLWCPEINVDNGQITNWEIGKTASIHYKVCDSCAWKLLDENDGEILSVNDGYVPDTLCPKGEGYGDYIIMDIDENGFIADWKFNIEDFSTADED